MGKPSLLGLTKMEIKDFTHVLQNPNPPMSYVLYSSLLSTNGEKTDMKLVGNSRCRENRRDEWLEEIDRIKRIIK